MPKSVDKAGSDEIFNSLAFFLSEAGVVFVILRTREVKRRVGSIEIATDIRFPIDLVRPNRVQ